jgi:hypothetical protein
LSPALRRGDKSMLLSRFHEVLPTSLISPEISLIPLRDINPEFADLLVYGKFGDRAPFGRPSPSCSFAVS